MLSQLRLCRPLVAGLRSCLVLPQLRWRSLSVVTTTLPAKRRVVLAPDRPARRPYRESLVSSEDQAGAISSWSWWCRLVLTSCILCRRSGVCCYTWWHTWPVSGVGVGDVVAPLRRRSGVPAHKAELVCGLVCARTWPAFVGSSLLVAGAADLVGRAPVACWHSCR